MPLFQIMHPSLFSAILKTLFVALINIVESLDRKKPIYLKLTRRLNDKWELDFDKAIIETISNIFSGIDASEYDKRVLYAQIKHLEVYKKKIFEKNCNIFWN